VHLSAIKNAAVACNIAMVWTVSSGASNQQLALPSRLPLTAGLGRSSELQLGSIDMGTPRVYYDCENAKPRWSSHSGAGLTVLFSACNPSLLRQAVVGFQQKQAQTSKQDVIHSIGR